MRLLLYGGTFDPPHNGHLNNLRAAAQRVAAQRIVIMPAGVPPHKQASATPAALRLEMCGCFRALAGESRLEISDWEIRQAQAGRRNYTVLTLEMLARTAPQAELYLTIGSDMLLSFDQWYRWQDILRLARLVVVSRDIGDDPALHRKARQLDPGGAHILFAPVTALPMASSALRLRLAAGDECRDALPEMVRRVIRREGLYRAVCTEGGKAHGSEGSQGSCAPPDGGQAL